jgi:formylglycine-generating enzyme required for sulfatase activity
MREDEKKPGQGGKDPDPITRPPPPYADETFGLGREGQPVLCITHHAAMEYCRWLSKKTGKAYRLPTEAEWEWACRAGTTTAYSFGDDPRDLGRYAWFGEDFAAGSTHPVGRKEPNPWGLHDVHGNVWEWVEDRFGERYYAESPPVDPHGPATGSARVVRGGSWHQTATNWRSAFRRQYEPDYRGISIGFRLVMSTER